MANKYLEKIAASKRLRKAVHVSRDVAEMVHITEHVQKKKKRLKKLKNSKSMPRVRKFGRTNAKTE